MNNNVIVVIPIYKSIPDSFETISFKQCINILHKHTICILTHAELDINFYISELVNKGVNYIIEFFHSDYFTSTTGYNRLLLSLAFYQRFKKYDYMLIYQLDAYVFRDELDYWCDKGSDYIGAPLSSDVLLIINNKSKNDFGEILDLRILFNGGFSIRKVESFINIVTKHNDVIEGYLQYGWNEDTVFSILFSQKVAFCLPSYGEALKFSFECYPREMYKINNNQMPFGCHAWYKEGGGLYDNEFWFKKIIPFHYYKNRVEKFVKYYTKKFF